MLDRRSMSFVQMQMHIREVNSMFADERKKVRERYKEYDGCYLGHYAQWFFWFLSTQQVSRHDEGSIRHPFIVAYRPLSFPDNDVNFIQIFGVIKILKYICIQKNLNVNQMVKHLLN